MEAYLEALQNELASPSLLTSFIEAIRFCDKVLNIQGLEAAISPKALNITSEGKRNQARVLRVHEVRFLETFLADERNVIVDRFAAGCFLFALFSRSRWSDLRCVYGHASDIVEIEGRIAGYVEYKTRSQKSARLVQKQGLSMPLVSPVWEVGTPPWALEFVKVARLADRRLDSLHNVHLLAAPSKDGPVLQQGHQHPGSQEVAPQRPQRSQQRHKNEHRPLPEEYRLELDATTAHPNRIFPARFLQIGDGR